MELDVGHVAACTWYWIILKYHGPVGRFVGFIQQIWWPYQPQPRHGEISPLWMQWEELHQLGPVVGTISTLEKGCGQ